MVLNFFNDLWCEERTCACWVSEEAAPVTKKNALPETKMFLNKKVFALAGIDLTPARYVRTYERTYDHAKK